MPTTNSRFPPASSLQQIACLRYAVPSILVIVMAFVIFEIVAFDLKNIGVRISEFLAANNSIDLGSLIKESNARIKWGTISLLYLFASIFLIVISINIIRQFLTRLPLYVFVGTGVFLAFVWFGYLVYGLSNNEPVSMIFMFTFNTLAKSGRFDGGQLDSIQAVIDSINIFATVIPVFAVIASCSTLVPCVAQGKEGANYYANQVRYLKDLLNAGSVMLLVGILHMSIWLRWPSAFLGDTKLVEDINNFSLAVSTFWGVAFTLLIAAYYIPSARILNRRAKAALADVYDDPAEVRQWLKENDLEMSTASQIREIVAISGPLLAGSLSTSFLGISAM